jgi:hypothetical protein
MSIKPLTILAGVLLGLVLPIGITLSAQASDNCDVSGGSSSSSGGNNQGAVANQDQTGQTGNNTAGITAGGSVGVGQGSTGVSGNDCSVQSVPEPASLLGLAAVAGVGFVTRCKLAQQDNA